MRTRILRIHISYRLMNQPQNDGVGSSVGSFRVWNAGACHRDCTGFCEEVRRKCFAEDKCINVSWSFLFPDGFASVFFLRFFLLSPPCPIPSGHLCRRCYTAGRWTVARRWCNMRECWLPSSNSLALASDVILSIFGIVYSRKRSMARFCFFTSCRSRSRPFWSGLESARRPWTQHLETGSNLPGPGCWVGGWSALFAWLSTSWLDLFAWQVALASWGPGVLSCCWKMVTEFILPPEASLDELQNKTRRSSFEWIRFARSWRDKRGPWLSQGQKSCILNGLARLGWLGRVFGALMKWMQGLMRWWLVGCCRICCIGRSIRIGMLHDIYMILLFDTEMILLNYKRNMHRSGMSQLQKTDLLLRNCVGLWWLGVYRCRVPADDFWGRGPFDAGCFWRGDHGLRGGSAHCITVLREGRFRGGQGEKNGGEVKVD